jgi:hypothetical protein
MAHIDVLPLLGDTQIALGIMSSCVAHQPSYLTRTISPSSFLPLLVGFNRKRMQVCADIMGSRLWESFKGPLVKCQIQLPTSFGGIGFLFMEDCTPSFF